MTVADETGIYTAEDVKTLPSLSNSSSKVITPTAGAEYFIVSVESDTDFSRLVTISVLFILAFTISLDKKLAVSASIAFVIDGVAAVLISPCP